MEIKGFKELERKIKELPEKVKRKEVIKILRTSAKPTLRAAKNEVPVASGNLKKSLGIIVGKKGRSKENPTIYVGPRSGGRLKYDGWYGAIVHGGRNVYRRGFKRRHVRSKQNANAAVKFIPGNPYMDRAYNQTKGQVTKETEKSVAKAIQRQIDKLSDK